MGILLIVLLILLLVGYFPRGGEVYAPLYGASYQPIGLVGLVVLVVLFFYLFGHVRF